MPKTIKGLSMLTAMVSGMVTLLIGAATVYTSHAEIAAQIDQHIELEMEALLNFHGTHSLAELVEVVRARDDVAAGKTGYLAEVDGADRIMGYAIFDHDGRRLAGSLIGTIPMSGWTEFLPIVRPDGSTGFAQALSQPLPGGQIVVAGDRSALNRSDRRIIMIVLMGVGAILVTGTVATIAFGRLVQQRLALISATAQGIVEGDYSRRVPLDGSDNEFERLSAILNDMFARVEALMQTLRQISSDIAHDMRTPLGRVRRRMEAMARSEDRSASRDALEEMISEMDDLLELFTGLLGVSEVEGFAARKRFRTVELDKVVDEVVDAYRPAFIDEGRAITVRLSPASVLGDEQLLKRAITNLLENVLAYAGPGANAVIDLSVSDHVSLYVSDDGKGVAPGDADRIFERLTRLDAARALPGHGLGLSMVRAIALVHRGTAKAVPSNVGLTVLMEFPKL